MNRNDSTFPRVKEDNYCISVVISYFRVAAKSANKLFLQYFKLCMVQYVEGSQYDVILESEVRSSAATIIRKLEKLPKTMNVP